MLKGATWLKFGNRIARKGSVLERGEMAEEAEVNNYIQVGKCWEYPERWKGYKGHPLFYILLDEIADLHSRKNADYAGDDPLSNLRLCQQFGIEPWRGCLVRMSDKWSRITQLANRDAEVGDEPIEDTLLDMAVYSLLCIVLRRER